MRRGRGARDGGGRAARHGDGPEEINAQLEKTGFRRNFPPPGVEIVSYHILMGVGQVIVLRFPPEKLREVNLAFERGAWGAFRTEFYPTYDYRAAFEEQRQKELARDRDAAARP